uniref:Uncharacterized protein n=1 Tax=Panagrolaimus superbus TaxID=310955 RepID=A0A914XXQ3_9BILA
MILRLLHINIININIYIITQQLLRGHSRSRSPSPGDNNGTPRSGRAVAGGTVYDSEVRYPSYFGHYPSSKPGPYRHIGQAPGDQYQMAHFATNPSGHSSYRTPPNSATTSTGQPNSSRRPRQQPNITEYPPSGALFDPDSSDPPSGYLTTRSGRYPSTPRSTYRSASQHPEYSDEDEDDDEPSESEPMTQRSSGGNYAPPNSANNTRRLPLIGQTMSLGYGGTRSHNDPALTQPPLPQRRPRPMSDNFSSSQPPPQTSTTRYGHIPPSPTPRSPAELHMYSDPSYPSAIPSTSGSNPQPSGNYSTHSLPPVAAPYGPTGAPRQPS